MSSIVFLISMGFVIYFLVKGDKKDRNDRDEELEQVKKNKLENKDIRRK
jgi:hypothetical protein